MPHPPELTPDELTYQTPVQFGMVYWVNFGYPSLPPGIEEKRILDWHPALVVSGDPFCRHKVPLWFQVLLIVHTSIAEKVAAICCKSLLYCKRVRGMFFFSDFCDYTSKFSKTQGFLVPFYQEVKRLRSYEERSNYKNSPSLIRERSNLEIKERSNLEKVT